MKRLLFVVFLMMLPLAVNAEGPVLSRAEGFERMWQKLERPIEDTWKEPFKDVQEGDVYYALLTYAKSRNFFPERETHFEPSAPLTLRAALVWLFRTRNVDYPDEIFESTLTRYLDRYPLLQNPENELNENREVTSDELNGLIEQLDQLLIEEIHIVSYYADGFEGNNTAFGEIFDSNELTAAHRTFPHNTLVKVRNEDNGKTVIVRINDRGPYIDGRDMDLSRASFARIGALGSGILRNVTFERLGTAKEEEDPEQCPLRYQRRVGRLLMSPGIPYEAPLGTTITLTGNHDFRLLFMRKPRTKPLRPQGWTERGKSLELSFDIVGTYTFVIHEDDGRRRRFRTRVTSDCS